MSTDSNIVASNDDVKSNDTNEDIKNSLQNCLLFPTYATRHDTVDGKDVILTDKWHVKVRGWAFSIPKSNKTQDIFLNVTSRIAGISKTDFSYECLKDRTAFFWTSNMSQGEYTVEIVDLTNPNKMTVEGDPNDTKHEEVDEDASTFEKLFNKAQSISHLKNEMLRINITPKSGHFSSTLSVPENLVKNWIATGRIELSDKETEIIDKQKVQNIKLLKLQAFQHDLVAPTFGVVNLIEPEGISIISDIDDTIKDTEILDGVKIVLSNTFMRPFKDVPGMAGLYHKWYDRGVAIHYVSNSPWQLFPPLRSFFKTYNFPPGSAHFKFYDGLIKSAVEQKENPMASKFMYIRELLKDFPKRKFILIGDTGELDPEIYTTIAKEHPDRIIRIFARDVTTSRVKDLPAQKAKHSYATTFPTIYGKLRDYYTEEEEKEKKLDVNLDNSGDSPKQSRSPLTPGTSSRIVEKLHGGLSSLLKTATPDTPRSIAPEPPSDVKLSSESSPTKTEPLSPGSPLDVKLSPTSSPAKTGSLKTPSPEVLRTPLEMFHERIKKLNEGLPEGLFSLFTDAKELDEDPIITNALANY